MPIPLPEKFSQVTNAMRPCNLIMKRQEDFDEQRLFDILKRAGRPLRLDDILRTGGFSRRLKRDILEALHDLARNGELVRLEGGSWVPVEALRKRRGILAAQRSGAAFVTPEDAAARTGQDIYIAPENVGDAWNGDVVDVMLLPMKRGSIKKQEGKVVAVVSRGQTEIVVRVIGRGDSDQTLLCRPADSRLNFDVLTDVSRLEKRPEEGELLRVTVSDKLKEKGGRPLWAGRAEATLGLENDAAVQERLTKLNNGIPMEFPDNVLAEAEEAAGHTSFDDPALADMRGEMLVTIDGEDARDFDDAVCASRTPDGWRLLVAIADVSYYVHPRTALDREARERGNSYYFPMSVEPMLPEALCNGVCSLRPGEERRCMAVDMRLDREGNLTDSRFLNAVMISRARLTYKEVQRMLDDPQGETAVDMEKKAPGVPAMLREAAALADVLMERRHRQGGLDFDLPEAEFLVEEKNGTAMVTGIRNRERLFSHRLIEAFMVRANEAVAEFLTRRNAPLLYRVHPAPGPDRLEELYHVLRSTDADLPLPRAAKAGLPGWLPHVLDAASGTDQSFVVSRLALRSMMQARYSPEEDGHFGLASSCYCHFTSPIRRYADLVNHRALRYVLGLDTWGALPAGHKLLETADQCNARERAATDAEREIGRRMGCLLLLGRTGERFGGVISGVMNFGFFVELDGMPTEGMVRVETLGRDYYIFDEERQELRGEHSGETFRLGQRVTVTLTGVHVGRLEIDLEYQKDEEERRPFRRRNDDRTPRRARSDRNEGEDRRSGRRAFADRKGFRPPRDDEELTRRHRYASDSWDDETPREEKPSFRSRPHTERPWNKNRRHQDIHEKDGDDFRPDGRSFRKKSSFRHGEERFSSEEDYSRNGHRSFRDRKSPRDLPDGDGHRAFRPARPRFRRDEESAGEGQWFRSERQAEGMGRRSGRMEREERRNDNRYGRPFPGKQEHGKNAYDEDRAFRPADRRLHEDGGHRRATGRHEDGYRRHESSFRSGRPVRDHKEHKDFHGAPDDFFAIDVDQEKNVHRFGRRRK